MNGFWRGFTGDDLIEGLSNWSQFIVPFFEDVFTEGEDCLIGVVHRGGPLRTGWPVGFFRPDRRPLQRGADTKSLHDIREFIERAGHLSRGFFDFLGVKTAKMSEDNDILNQFSDNLLIEVEKVWVVIEKSLCRGDELLKNNCPFICSRSNRSTGICSVTRSLSLSFRIETTFSINSMSLGVKGSSSVDGTAPSSADIGGIAERRRRLIASWAETMVTEPLTSCERSVTGSPASVWTTLLVLIKLII